jgi:hypothetical protein
MHSYKAWLPNVSGRISFENIKGRKIPGRAECPRTINTLGDDERGWLFSWQHRDLSDALFSVFTRDSRLAYFLEARIGEDYPGTLTGRVLTVAYNELKPSVAPLTEAFDRSHTFDKDAAHELRTLLDRLEQLQSARVFAVTIESNGITALEYDDIDAEFSDTFAFEAFSFLKDLIHAHKFHRIDEDAIAIPFRVTNQDDSSWIAKTERNLHASIISTYRTAHYRSDLINALGKLSYLEAFIDRIVPDGEKVTAVNTARLRSSLDTRLAATEEHESRHSLFTQVSLPILVGIVALVVGMTQLLQVPCIIGMTDITNCRLGTFKLDPYAFRFAKEIIESWQTYLSATVVGVVVMMFYGYRRHLFRAINDRWGRPGFGGTLLRVLFSAAVSRRWGRALASFWIFMLTLVMLGLLFVSLHSLVNLV